VCQNFKKQSKGAFTIERSQWVFERVYASRLWTIHQPYEPKVSCISVISKMNSYYLIFFMFVMSGMMNASIAQMVGIEKNIMQIQFQIVAPGTSKGEN
jgi:hypothetical protein